MTSTPETAKPQDSTRAMRVWVQLAELFGKAFYRENGDVPPKLWVQAINRLPDSHITKGLVNLANDGLEFPPNLSLFMEACRRQEPIAPWRALPPPPPDPKVEADKAWEYMERLAGRPLRDSETFQTADAETCIQPEQMNRK